MLPILYSFRRCPYAIRARLAILLSGQQVELREVVLRDKPQELINISPKATVPVLLDTDGQVIDESLAIMHWAFSRQDSAGYWQGLDEPEKLQALSLIQTCDEKFKPWLDRYKYCDNNSHEEQLGYRQKAMTYITAWNTRLSRHACLVSGKPTLADIAIVPFVRQFSLVDKDWFAQCQLLPLQQWLSQWLASDIFLTAMQKYEQWPSGHCSKYAGAVCDNSDHVPVLFPKQL